MAISYLQQFAESGNRVFSLESIDGIYCGCGNTKCTATGKHPVSANWQNTPEWDEDQIDGLNAMIEHLGRGFGVLCNNLLVVDVDAKNGGIESYARLLERFPDVASAGLIVETGSGGGSKHLYFSLPADIHTIQSSPEFPGIDFKHTGFVVGPGSPHKSGKKYNVLSGNVDEIDKAPEGLVAFLKRPERRHVEFEGSSTDISDNSLRSMLGCLTCYDEYSDWVKIGMAIHDATQGNGVAIWDEWSKRSSKYNPESIDIRWHSFGKSSNPVTVGTLIKLAKDSGWIERVEMDDVPLQGWFAKALTGSSVTEGMTKEDIKDVKSPLKGCPVDVSTIDLTMPPGFCGEVTRWINTQCRYPRLNLAAMASLYAIGNISGLNYAVDDNSQTRANMALFCVAGSGTGKDAVLEAVSKIIITAGMSECNHGKIKSDREMYQNLIHHQAAFYTIDEVGAHLAKISNAGRSGASHLEGVIETFMAVYSKAESFHILGGDDKRELSKILRDRLSFYARKVEENEDVQESKMHIEAIKKRLLNADRLVEPFLSLAGFTTPTQFSRMMTIENAETGFLGRTIMCVEPDINPYPNQGFTKENMPLGMSMKISQLASAGSTKTEGERIERRGDLHLVKMTDEAKKLIDRCMIWVVDYNQSKIELGLEPFSGLYRRVCEKAIKMSLILGIADGEIDVEHVKWAMAASMRDVEEKVSAITIEDKSFSKSDKLVASILKCVKNKPGQTFSYIFGRSNIRGKYQREDVQKVITAMVQKNELRVQVDTDKRNGEKLERYFIR